MSRVGGERNATLQRPAGLLVLMPVKYFSSMVSLREQTCSLISGDVAGDSPGTRLCVQRSACPLLTRDMYEVIVIRAELSFYSHTSRLTTRTRSRSRQSPVPTFQRY